MLYMEIYFHSRKVHINNKYVYLVKYLTKTPFSFSLLINIEIFLFHIINPRNKVVIVGNIFEIKSFLKAHSN